MTDYAVGDIQGCFLELKKGLEEINFNPKKDFLWITGDLINRGPESLEVMNFVFENKNSIHLVLGNHDLHFLNLFFNQAKMKKEDTLKGLLNSSKANIYAEFLTNQPIFFNKEISHGKKNISVAMVHAGIPDNLDLDQCNLISEDFSYKIKKNPKKFLKKIFKKNSGSHSSKELLKNLNFFTRVRVCNSQGKPKYSFKDSPKNIPKNYMPWFNRNLKILEEIDLLVFGHWAALAGKTKNKSIKALDTGCCWGRELTIMRLADKKKYKIKSIKR